MKRPIAVIVALALCSALVAVTAPLAIAEVGATQQVRIRDESPEVGRHSIGFRNYGEKTVCERRYPERPPTWCGYRVTKGRIDTKLTTYKLVESRTAYDYYLVDIDMNVSRSGSSKLGWVNGFLRTRDGVRQVDRTETATINATKNECDTLKLALATPWPVVSASADLGSVRFCDSDAYFRRNVLNWRTTEYKANRLGKTNHLSAQRWVKVPQGAQPRFTLRLVVPNDSCTKYWYSYTHQMNVCVAYDNSSHQKIHYVHTRLSD